MVKKTEIIEKAPAKAKKATIAVVDMLGKSKGTVAVAAVLSEEVAPTLITQAVRVYRTNERQGNSATKTRGEVSYSTRKIYKQKGTGRARHGSRKAPIFVGGGITFGPQPRDFNQKMPAKMRTKALHGTLHAKIAQSHITVIDDISGMKPKTKEAAELLNVLQLSTIPVLMVINESYEPVVRAFANIQSVTLMRVQDITAYDVMQHRHIVIEQKALAYFEKGAKHASK